MAQILQKRSDLKKSYIFAKTLTFISFCGAFFCLVGAVTSKKLLFCLGMIVTFIIGFYNRRNAQIYRCGLVGERATVEFIRKLPREYYAVQNVKVAYGGKSSELDMVVVGPAGVFVIETKYLKGVVVGSYASDHWLLQKHDSYSRTFYNPIKQVNTHVYRLANFLRKEGVNVWVDGMVCFSHPETVLRLKGKPLGVPVYSVRNCGADNLCSCILRQEAKLTGQEIKRIVQLICAGKR